MSSSDKRSVVTDALETLGKCPIPDDSGRDAIHLAVEPVVAAEVLRPGQRVGLVNGEASANAEKLLGVVDPFIGGVVQPGQRFWLVVFPRQITSLRHVWSHPDFNDIVEEETSPSRFLGNGIQIKESFNWIQNFAESIGQDFNSVMAAADLYAKHGSYTYDNSEAYKNHWDQFPEFWDHYQVVTGKRVSDPGVFFTCAC